MSRPKNAAIGVITNPNSKKNRLRQGRAAELQRIVGEHGIVRETRSIEEIGPAIDEFLERDVRYWVSDGGDGALHWLINEARGPLGARGLGLPLTVPTNGGTIDFVAKKVGIRGQADEILRRLVRAEQDGRTLPTEEVGSFILTGERLQPDGTVARFEKLGFATAVVGIGQRFFGLYYQDPSPGPDTLVKIIARGVGSIALNAPIVRSIPFVPASWRDYVQQLLKPQQAKLRIDSDPVQDQGWRGIHVGSMFVDIGGIVRLFHMAGEGKLHIMFGNPNMLEVLANLPKLFGGKPMSRGMFDRRATRVEVEATGDELLNPCIDGEMFSGLKRVVIEPGPVVRIPRIDCSKPD